MVTVPITAALCDRLAGCGVLEIGTALGLYTTSGGGDGAG